MKKYYIVCVVFINYFIVQSMDRRRDIIPLSTMSLEELVEMNSKFTRALSSIERRRLFLQREVLELEFTENSNGSQEFHTRFNQANNRLGECLRCHQIVVGKERNCIQFIENKSL